MRRFSEWLDHVASGWLALAGVAVFALFIVFVLPAQSSVEPAGSAQNVRSPDLSFWYTPSDLYATAATYGIEGRAAYVRARGTFDILWPLVYTAFLALTLSWISRRMPDRRRWRRANLVPIGAGAFDLLENVCTSVVMLRYPATTPVVDVLAPAFTVSKWTFLGVAFVLAGVGTVLVVWDAIRVRLQPQG